MPGNPRGGQKARQTMIENLGGKKAYKAFMQGIGRKGGQASPPEKRPFALNRELASRAGTKGGKVSRRH